MAPIGRAAALALAAASLLGTGCAATCEEACRGVAVACASTFESAGVGFDQAACLKDCQGSYPDCPEVETGSLNCLAGATRCEQTVACSSCGGSLPLAISQPACSLACLGVGRVCEADRKAAGLPFEVALCVADCVSNPRGCANAREQTACRAAALSCAEAGRCPGCDP